MVVSAKAKQFVLFIAVSTGQRLAAALKGLPTVGGSRCLRARV